MLKIVLQLSEDGVEMATRPTEVDDRFVGAE